MSEQVAIRPEAPSVEKACGAEIATEAPSASLGADLSLVVQEPSTTDTPAAAQASLLARTSLATKAPSIAESLLATEAPLAVETPSAAKIRSKLQALPKAEAPSAAKGSAATETPQQTKVLMAVEVSAPVQPSPVAEAPSAADTPAAAKALTVAEALPVAQVLSVSETPSVADTASTPAQKLESGKEATEKMKVNTALAEETALISKGKRKAGDGKTAGIHKRRTLSPQAGKKLKESEEEETESEPEKQPKKRAKTVKGAKKSPRTPGRKKKVLTEPLDNADEEQKVVEKKVEALSDEIKGRFGHIVWAKMGGYPFWPCIIADPRLLPKKLQETAMKTLGSKYLVFFYVSNNFAPISFKKIVPWNDTKFGYREGHPEKDSKAPKRRAKLMTAIEIADKESKLPMRERANGLLKPEKRVKGVETAVDKTPLPVKRKPGRPPKAKPLIKTTPKKTPKKIPIKEETEEVGTDKEGKDAASVFTRVEEEEPEVAGPTLSKEEIKAKVASRKAPKKKEADDIANAPTASTKKAPKVTAKQTKPTSFVEIDSKRKKEIELVVPHKSVKSADIREMTEEAAKKKHNNGLKIKTKKDKGEYNVGDLAAFANKMVRLHANESSRNNDKLVGMMQELFKEELMYRSDVERSGLAAIIALLRKSLSPTVGHTASALRKHMINILSNDTDIIRVGKKGFQDTATSGSKKRKTESGNFVVSEVKQSKFVSSSETKEIFIAKDIDPLPPAIESPMENTEVLKVAEVQTEVSSELVKTVVAEVAPVKELEAPLGKDKAMITEDPVKKTKETTDKRSASPIKTEVPAEGIASNQVDLFEVPEHMEKNRTIFVNMLSKILDQNGSKRADLASEIEAALFERFKESNDDYLTQARIIIFGLKENTSMRKRLFSGALHCLEFAYADDAFFKTSE